VTALSVKGLHAYYGESHVLQGVSIDVPDGGAVSLIGRNGAGKSTTIAAIVGFIRPRAGTITVRGVDLTGRAPHEIGRRGVALVPQGRRVFRDLTVRENLTLSIHRDGAWDLDRVLALFPSLGRRLESFGDQLSGGEQQMVAIGRALMRDPAVLLLDEPSEGLAPKLVNEVGDALLRLRDSGLAILLVEQNLALATRIGQRVFVMNKGTIVFEGTADELAASREVEARYLGLSAV
jgi:branched-chain amino acid transport system ATP-binding protein